MSYEITKTKLLQNFFLNLLFSKFYMLIHNHIKSKLTMLRNSKFVLSKFSKRWGHNPNLHNVTKIIGF